MMVPSARSVVDRIRRYAEDIGAKRYSDDRILETVQEAAESLLSLRRLYSQYHDLDRLLVPRSSFTQVEEFWLEYDALPSRIAEVKQVEGVRGATGPSFIIPEGELYTTGDMAPMGGVVWTFTGPGYPGAISIQGPTQDFLNFRIYYIRRYPTLHFGTLEAGSTTTSLVFPASPASGNEVSGEDDVYTGLRVVLEGQNVTRQIRSYDGATRTATVDALTSSASGESYSLCPPFAPEHTHVLVLKASLFLATQAGNVAYMSATKDLLSYHERKYRESVAQRSTTTPSSVWTDRSRTRRRGR